jgi:anti-anti-sigma factor
MAELLHFQHDGDCLWITPKANVELSGTPEMSALKQELQKSGAVRLVVDLSGLPHFGSNVLGFLVLLWKRVAQQDGRLVLHKPSASGREVLAISRLDQLWPIAQTREDAMRLVQEADREA